MCAILLFSFGLAVEGTWGGGDSSAVINNGKHYMRMCQTTNTCTSLGHHAVTTDTSKIYS